MDKIKFVSSSSFKDIKDNFNNIDYNIEDYKGIGVYCFIISCRG